MGGKSGRTDQSEHYGAGAVRNRLNAARVREAPSLISRRNSPSRPSQRSAMTAWVTRVAKGVYWTAICATSRASPGMTRLGVDVVRVIDWEWKTRSTHRARKHSAKDAAAP